MSPIGRVFIVFNLALAGGFVFVSGQLLQNQANYKQQVAEVKEESEKVIAEKDQAITSLESDLSSAETGKTNYFTQLTAANNAKSRLEDENKRLAELTGSQDASIKQLASLQKALNEDQKAMATQVQEAYAASIKSSEEKDSAVRSKDTFEAENRTLTNTIAALNEQIGEKDVALASMRRDNDEKGLLLAAARAGGFIDSMAAPVLAGTVTMATDRLVTIAVGDNPGNVDIQDMISRNP
ncbi:MAG: hypothetical protein AB8H80_16380, partial [Planctomycetota bacterium]